MNNSLLRIFHRLPYPLKIIAASLKGGYLHHLRYGGDMERVVRETINRESWDANRWEKWQNECLAFLLHRAATKVPHYKIYWQKERKLGNRASWAYLENWPILSKEAVRKNPQAFVAEDSRISKMYIDHTSGTTGTPISIYQNKKSVRYWYALVEARWRRWYGVSYRDRWAIFGGQLVTEFNRSQPPFWVWNAGLKQLYCSSYHINQENCKYYLEALNHYNPYYVLGYPSALYTLSRFSAEQSLQPPKIKFILSNAEPLYAYQREAIQSFFNGPVYDTYGMSETVAAASECDHGVLHLWPETGVFELTGDDHKPVTNQTGSLISTGLINPDMPLIRYHTGDFVSIDMSYQLCKCGRSLPRLLSIDGRSDDLIITKDGRQIGRLDPIFKDDFHIKEAQIIQEEIDLFIIKYVPSKGWTKEDCNNMRAALIDRVGNVKVIFEEMKSIPRTKAGKFQAVISKVK